MEIILTGIWECCAYIFVEAGLEVFFYGIGRLCLSPFNHDESKRSHRSQKSKNSQKSNDSQKDNHQQESEKHYEPVYTLVGVIVFFMFIISLYVIRTLFS